MLRLEVIPATYKWGTERVLVKAASSKLVTIPAKYENRTEKILEKAAHTIWKKGSGEIEKIDNSTGEIMCLVEVPATYRTVTSRVQVSPPATRTIEIPAEYKTIKVKTEATAPSTRSITIPAEYQTVTKRVKVTEEVMEWRAILCKTNATHAKVMSIQRALKKAGNNPGPIDGVIGSQTKAAVKAFQRAKGLALGGFTHETLQKLGL